MRQRLTGGSNNKADVHEMENICGLTGFGCKLGILKSTWEEPGDRPESGLDRRNSGRVVYQERFIVGENRRHLREEGKRDY